MAKSRCIKGVLRGFLGTYSSRYTDYRGYWLFGLLVTNFDELTVNLLAPQAGNPESALATAWKLAATKFADQVRKAGLGTDQIQEARLSIKRSPEATRGLVNDHPCAGRQVTFHVCALMDNATRYEDEEVVFVAPHDPRIERRRHEKDWEATSEETDARDRHGS